MRLVLALMLHPLLPALDLLVNVLEWLYRVGHCSVGRHEWRYYEVIKVFLESDRKYGFSERCADCGLRREVWHIPDEQADEVKG